MLQVDAGGLIGGVVGSLLLIAATALAPMLELLDAEKFGGVHFFALADVGEGEFGLEFAGGLAQAQAGLVLKHGCLGLSVLDFDGRAADILVADPVLQHRKRRIRGQIVHFFDALEGHGACRLRNFLVDVELGRATATASKFVFAAICDLLWLLKLDWLLLDGG